MRIELIRELDVLRGVITEAIHAILHSTCEIIVHAIRNSLVLGVQIPETKQMALRDLPTIAIINAVTIVTRVLLLVADAPRLMEVVFRSPVRIDGVPIGTEVVDDAVDNHTDTVLVRLSSHRLEVIFSTHDLVADLRASWLINVIPVLVELHAVDRPLNLTNRRGLDGRITSGRNLRHLLLDCIERPHPCMQDGAVAHLSGEAVLLACRFELRVAKRAVITCCWAHMIRCNGRGGTNHHTASERRCSRKAGDRLFQEPAPRWALIRDGGSPVLFRQRCHATVSFSSLDKVLSFLVLASRHQSRKAMRNLPHRRKQ